MNYKRAIDLAMYYSKLHKKKVSGFTLIELLVAVLIGLLATTGMWALAIQILQDDRRDLARTEVQRDMNQALEFMATEVREAVYVYEAECLNINASATNCPNRNVVNAGVPTFLPSLANTIGLPLTGSNAVVPVLAFWKLERLPYVETPTGNQALPTSTQCNAFVPDSATATPAQIAQQNECNSLRIGRNAYTLVIYTLVQRPSSSMIFDGPAMIRRYQLREYQNTSGNGIANVSRNFNTSPNPSFISWVCTTGTSNTNCTSSGTLYSQVEQTDLVDYVDYATTPAAPACPANYSLSGQTGTFTTGNTNSNFYACIRRPQEDIGLLQDVQIFLRGNALARANLTNTPLNPTNVNSVQVSFYKPFVQTQTQARSVFNRTPPE